MRDQRLDDDAFASGLLVIAARGDWSREIRGALALGGGLGEFEEGGVDRKSVV